MKTKTLKKETEYIRKNAKYAEIFYAPNSKWVENTKFMHPVLKVGFEEKDERYNPAILRYIWIRINPKSKLLNEIEKRIKFNPYKDEGKRFPRYRVEINSLWHFL